MGLGFPLVVAALTVPALIGRLGAERFGLLTLAWGLIGYAGALDIGVGRALTQMVGRLRGEGQAAQAPTVVSTAARISLVSGAVGTVVITAIAMAGGGSWINAHGIPAAEIRNAMLVLALGLPAQAAIATYRGVNEAFLNFKGISVLRMALGVVNFGGPYLMAFYTRDLAWLVATLVASRVCALVLFRWLAASCLNRNLGTHKATPAFSLPMAKALFSFGGWVTVSAVVSPILVQADRFIIAFVLTAAAVTVYVVPYEVVVRSLIVVGAVSSVMFPAMSAMVKQDPDLWKAHFRRWSLSIGVLMAVVCIVVAVALPTVLRLWLKGELDPASIVIGQILCLGVFANSIGSMFFALLQAKGRADITAKMHMIELPLYVGALIVLLDRYGIVGAAWAWVGRMVFDALGLASWASRDAYLDRSS